MSTERLLQVIRAPHVSEKTVRIQGEVNQYVFKVDRAATKADIKSAVEDLFKVKVDNVRVINVKGKSKSFRFRQGQRADWRKAYVKLMPGQSIDLGGEG